MARIRTIKPEFFDDPDVIDLSMPARLLFIGLWTQADRRGRLLDEPRRLKIRLMPGDDVDVDALLGELAGSGLLVRYEVDGRQLLWIRHFERHQHPHVREVESILAPYEPGASIIPSTTQAMPEHNLGSPQPGGHGVRSTYTGTGTEQGPSPALPGPSPVSRPKPSHPRPVQGRGAGAGSNPRDHLKHGYCPFHDEPSSTAPCVPVQLHGQFLQQLAQDADLLAKFYRQIATSTLVPCGDDPWNFWRDHFSRAIGQVAPPPPSANERRRQLAEQTPLGVPSGDDIA